MAIYEEYFQFRESPLSSEQSRALLSDMVDQAVCLRRDAHSENALVSRHRGDAERGAECHGRARALQGAADSLLRRLGAYLPEGTRPAVAEFVLQEGRRRFEKMHGGEG